MESDSGYSTVNVRPWVTWLLPAVAVLGPGRGYSMRSLTASGPNG